MMVCGIIIRSTGSCARTLFLHSGVPSVNPSIIRVSMIPGQAALTWMFDRA